jgi:excisionase family DNA binding protein
MPRARRERRLWPVALPVNAAAATLGVHVRHISAAIEAGELPAYSPSTGIRRRVVLVEDLVLWVREHWRRS